SSLFLHPLAHLQFFALSYTTLFRSLAYALRYPALLVGVLLFFALRRWVPDPVVLLRTVGKIRSLRMQVTANPAAKREEQQHTDRSEEHTSELQSLRHLVCRLLLDKK